MNPLQWWLQSDAVSQACALVLLLMSLASWVVIVWQAYSLGRARRQVPRCIAAFWQTPHLAQATQLLAQIDRSALVLVLVQAAHDWRERAQHAASATPTSAAPALGQQGQAVQQLTRALRSALQTAQARLQWGQVLLASVGATAPFVGLLGTVWGIRQALGAMAAAGHISIERLAGPVGEALVMTAAGLAVALPAVLAYNGLARLAAPIDAELEGLAHDLRELLQAP